MKTESKVAFERVPRGVIAYRIEESGTAYRCETPERVIEILESARISRDRLRIQYGDRETGRAWDDEPTACYVGRSTGRIKIPLTILTARSLGGCAMLDNHIIRIERKRAGARHYSTIYEAKAPGRPTLNA